jgi:proteasome lid subunit RPN8/RPN11
VSLSIHAPKDLREGESLRGCWHSHVTGEGDPSSADRVGWRMGYNLLRDAGQPWVGVIVSVTDGKLHAWITDDSGHRPVSV